MEALLEYEELKIQASKIEDRLKELAPKVKEAVDTIVGQKLETDKGTFYFSIRRTYNYSSKVKEVEAELKKIKAEEEKTVDFKESKVLTFRIKNETN